MRVDIETIRLYGFLAGAISLLGCGPSLTQSPNVHGELARMLQSRVVNIGLLPPGQRAHRVIELSSFGEGEITGYKASCHCAAVKFDQKSVKRSEKKSADVWIDVPSAPKDYGVEFVVKTKPPGLFEHIRIEYHVRYGLTIIPPKFEFGDQLIGETKEFEFYVEDWYPNPQKILKLGVDMAGVDSSNLMIQEVAPVAYSYGSPNAAWKVTARLEVACITNETRRENIVLRDANRESIAQIPISYTSVLPVQLKPDRVRFRTDGSLVASAYLMINSKLLEMGKPSVKIAAPDPIHATFEFIQPTIVKIDLFQNETEPIISDLKIPLKVDFGNVSFTEVLTVLGKVE